MSMKPYEGRVSSLEDTPFGYTLSMIGGKWRLVILYWLAEQEATRFNELRRRIGRITEKTLSAQLKDMERDGLVVRTEYPQIPPKVEYSLSEKGRSLYPLMEQMCAWGEAHRSDAEMREACGLPQTSLSPVRNESPLHDERRGTLPKLDVPDGFPPPEEIVRRMRDERDERLAASLGDTL